MSLIDSLGLRRVQFRDLQVGDAFDFVSGVPGMDSFYKRCEKISPRKYQDGDGVQYRVGSVKCQVYNVVPK